MILMVSSMLSAQLSVSRDREGGFQPGIFKRYRRVNGSLGEMIRAIFLRGVSTGKVGEILGVLPGERLSAGKVSMSVRESGQAVIDLSCKRKGSSCDRIVYAIFHCFNDKWQRHREKIPPKTLWEKTA